MEGEGALGRSWKGVGGTTFRGDLHLMKTGVWDARIIGSTPRDDRGSRATRKRLNCWTVRSGG